MLGRGGTSVKLKFEAGLDQSQRIVIVPELKQALKVLQYSSDELYNFIQSEMEQNPLFELCEEVRRIGQENDDADFPVDWKEYFGSAGYHDDPDNTGYYEDEREFSYENIVCRDVTLHEYLLEQLKVLNISQTDKRIAAFIIENLDDNGYLLISKHEIACILNTDRKSVFRMLHLVQTMDPPGVGARSLRECMLIQLARMGKLNPTVKIIVLEHLNDIAHNRLALISRRLAVSIQEVQRISDLIRSLEPKPGRKFASARGIRYITPDVTVRKIGNDYHISIEEHTAPRLRINRVYRKILQQSNLDPGVAEYIRMKLNRALCIIKAVEQRRNTIIKVSMSIVKHQREFLDNGPRELKPLSLQMVAHDCGLHASTVSRAIDNKYIQTPRGIYDMKYFFTGPVETEDGLEMTAEGVKEIIRSIIADEDIRKPLSDQKISEVLREKGIAISRRTVAKYRKQLGISNSVLRKRYC
jgi:RNA polymerase sigma-54 factor